MRAIQRKLLRDLWRTRGQVITIALVLAAGVAAYVSMTGAHRALTTSRDAYYTERGFPDLFVHLVRAPDSVRSRLEAIPGVTSVETRLVEWVTFRLPGVARSPTGVAISARGLPDSLVLRSGRGLDPGRDDEVLLLESFAIAQGFEPGDHIDLVLGGRELHPRIAGLVLSPEYVFPATAGVASFSQFGVVWVDEDALAGATGRRGVFDDATFRLTPGASRPAAIAEIDRILAPWGGGGAYGRERQMSNRTINGELDQLEVLALWIPAVFLLVAAFLLHAVLSRMVQVQREELAVLRAVGYTRAALARHVLAYAAVIAVLGSILGVGLGLWFGDVLLGVYDDYFHFPLLEVPLDVPMVITTLLVTGVPSTSAALGAVRRVVRLAPAQAMRPPSPARYRRGVLSRLGLARIAGPTGRMIVRDLERRPILAIVSILGIAFAGAMVVLGRFNVDAIRQVLDVYIERSMRDDVSVSLVRPVPRGELDWFRRAPGVLSAEPIRVVPVRLRNGWRDYDTALTGMPAGGRLRSILDSEGRRVAVPESGVLLTELLGERLGVGPGDPLEVERLDEDRGSFTVTVRALVDERMGMNAYMELDVLSRVLGDAPQMTTVLLEVEPGARDRLLRHLEDVPAVTQIIETSMFRDAFEAQSAEMVLVMTLVIVIFATVIAIGVIYNTARVSLSERSRDLATLRVLGFTREEVAKILLGQLVVQVAIALPLAMLLGPLLVQAILSQVDPEQYRLPAVVSPATFAFATLVVIAASLAAGLVVRRKLDQVDIVSALKARD